MSQLRKFYWYYKAYVCTTYDARHCYSYFSVFYAGEVLPPKDPPLVELFKILVNSLILTLNSLGVKAPPWRTPLVTINPFDIVQT